MEALAEAGHLSPVTRHFPLLSRFNVLTTRSVYPPWRAKAFGVQSAIGRIDLLAPAHVGPSAWSHLCRSHPCGSIRRGGRFNASTLQRLRFRFNASQDERNLSACSFLGDIPVCRQK